MRILLICHYFAPEPGAPQARLLETARAWVRLGHEVTVVTGFPNHPTGILSREDRGRLYREDDLDGIRVLRCWSYATPNRGIVKKTLGHLSFMATAVLLGGVRAARPDVIVVSSPTFFSVLSAFALSLLRRAPFVFEVRDLWPAIFTELGILTNRAVIRLLEGLELFLYRRSALVVPVTGGFRDDIVRRGIPAEKVETITNGVDTGFFRLGADREKAKRRLGLEGRFVVLYLGAHGISHALSRILEVADRWRNDPEAVFVFVGDGAEKPGLKAAAAERGLPNVRFLDPVPKADVPGWYAAADVGLVPLRDVPLFRTFIPSKMFEIMGTGTPVVGSVTGEAAEILGRSGGAIVTGPENVEGIDAALRHLRGDPALRERLGRAGRDFVEREYDRSELAKRYLAHLEIGYRREVRVTVLVTGATGFTGRRVVRTLVCEAGRPVRCFVRAGSDRSVLEDLPVEFRIGDLGDPGSLRKALGGVEVLVNTASIGFGHAPAIVDACRREHVRRAVFFSTTAIFTSLPAPSRRLRLAAEETIRDSGLAFTILRPTMIYGAPGDRNVERMLRTLARTPVMPVVGGGGRRIQPVLVDDLAKAVVAVLDSPGTVGRAYELPGKEPVGFGEFVRLAARAVGRRIALLPIHPALAIAGARIHERLSSRPRIKAEQILRLLEDKDFSWRRAGRDFGYDPTSVPRGLSLEAKRLGLGGQQ